MSNNDRICAAIYVGAKTIYTRLPAETQVAYFDEIIKEQKLKYAGVYTDTEEDPSSPNYQAAFKLMLQDAKAHGINRILCISCSAIDRDPSRCLDKIKSAIAEVSPDFSFYFAIEDLDTADDKFFMGLSFMATMWKEFEVNQRRANKISRVDFVADLHYKGHPLINLL